MICGCSGGAVGLVARHLGREGSEGVRETVAPPAWRDSLTVDLGRSVDRSIGRLVVLRVLLVCTRGGIWSQVRDESPRALHACHRRPGLLLLGDVLLLGIGCPVSGAPSPPGPRVGPAYVPMSRLGLSPRSVRGDAMELSAGRLGRRVSACGAAHRVTPWRLRAASSCSTSMRRCAAPGCRRETAFSSTRARASSTSSTASACRRSHDAGPGARRR